MNITQKVRSIILTLLIVVAIIVIVIGVGVPSESRCGGDHNPPEIHIKKPHRKQPDPDDPPPEEHPKREKVYDIIMRECTGVCGYARDPENCQSSCQRYALFMSGIDDKNPPSAGGVDALTRKLLTEHRDNPTFTPKDYVYVFQPREKDEGDSLENYSSFVRSNPSHSHENNRQGFSGTGSCSSY